jgi:hypothetical protein
MRDLSADARAYATDDGKVRLTTYGETGAKNDLSDLLDEMASEGVLDVVKHKPARCYPGPRSSQWGSVKSDVKARDIAAMAKQYG